MTLRPSTLAPGGMIVASHPLAVEAGAAILRAGGHAAEAVVAAGAVLAVVEPSASGLGGDAFLLIWDRDDGAAAINGSGRSPLELTPEQFAGEPTVPLRGPLACTVPGCVAAWEEAWYGWGRLQWADLLAPAVALAREGFALSWRMGRIVRRERALLTKSPELARLYLRSDGSPKVAGDLCRNPALAATLAATADQGGDTFYRGEVADRLVRGVRSAGGALDLQDLAGHESDLRPPLEFPLEFGPASAGPSSRTGGETRSLAGLVLLEQPLPSQGILLPILLGLTQGGGGPESDPLPPWETLHRQIEAAKIIFALRQLFLTDPEFLPVPEMEMVEALLDPRTLRALAPLVHPDRAAEPPAAATGETTPASDAVRSAVVSRLDRFGEPWKGILSRYRDAGYATDGGAAPGRKGSDTTYLCAVDADGNAAGLIQSIFHPFGSGFCEPATGILLNNRAAGFSLDPRHPNRLEPGKRSLHTLNSYMMLRDGNPWMVGGTPGADNQLVTNLQVLGHLLAGRVLWPGPAPQVKETWTQARQSVWDRPRLEHPDLLCAALGAPRWSVHADGRIRMEARMASEVRRRLERKGHRIVRVGPWEGSGLVQAIRILDNGARCGATDPRGEGLALAVGGERPERSSDA